MIYLKVSTGQIDATKETSGVRLGDDVKVDQIKGARQKFTLTSEEPSRSGCTC